MAFLFGTVGSPNSTPSRPGGSISGVQRIAELDLKTLELGWVQSVRISEKSCLEIANIAKKLGVSISVHAPYFINLNADQIEWPKSKKRLIDAAYYGNIAGASDIVFHPGSYGHDPHAALKNAIIRLKDIIQELRKMKVIIRLRPETMGKSALLGSLEDVITMSKMVQEVEPCLDFAHLYARSGNGSLNTTDEWIQILMKYQNELGKDALKRLHIHLSGIEFNPKGERKHLAINESSLDIGAIFRALKTLNCQGRILCESPLMEDDALLLKQIWNENQ